MLRFVLPLSGLALCTIAVVAGCSAAANDDDAIAGDESNYTSEAGADVHQAEPVDVAIVAIIESSRRRA